MMTRQHQRALTEAQQAIDLSPNFALGFFALGFSRIYMGRFEEALEPLLRCIRLSPHDPMGFLFVSMLTLAYYHLGRYEESIQTAERALRGRRIYVSLRRSLKAYTRYYNEVRTHRSLLNDAPETRPIQFTGPVRSRPVLGELHDHYVRV